MTQQAKQVPVEQQPVQRTLETNRSLVDLFHGDQQGYARLPTGNLTPLAYGPREVVISGADAPTLNTTSGAWIVHGVESIHVTAALQRPTTKPSGPIYVKERHWLGDLYAARSRYTLPATPIKSYAPGADPITSVNLLGKLSLTDYVAHVYWNIAFARAGDLYLGDVGDEVPNYEGAVVFRGGTMSTQDLVAPVEETAEKVIWDSVPSLPISDKGELVRRLLALEKALRDEDDPTCPGISVGSLRKFLAFMKSNPDLKLPVLSISPDCNVYASWKADLARVFSIHFIPDGDARFVLFQPSRKRRGEVIRLSGSAMSEEVIDIAKREGAMDWIVR